MAIAAVMAMALRRRSPGVGVETADTSISGQNIWHTVFEPAVLTIPVRGVAQAEDGTPFSISEGVARGYLETGCPGESSACQNHFEGSVQHDALSFLRDLTTRKRSCTHPSVSSRPVVSVRRHC